MSTFEIVVISISALIVLACVIWLIVATILTAMGKVNWID